VLSVEFRRVSDYIEGIDENYFLSEYGELYWRVKSYNGSYKVNLHDEEGKPHQVTITKYIKDYIGKDITQEIIKDVWVIQGVICVKRYLNPEKRNNYIDVRLYYKDSKERFKTSIHRLVNLVFNGYPLSLDTHHKDGNRLNNHYTNLIGMTKSEHRKHHIDDGIMQKYSQFNAIHNGIEGLVTCDMSTFCRITGVNYRAVIRGYTGDRTWVFKDFVIKK
jgi:hypothetical protein